MSNVRAAVINILHKNERVWDKKLQLSGYTQNDRNLITEMINGIERRKLTLKYLIQHYSRSRPQAKVYNCLLLGIYELLFVNKSPAYAVIHSCVEESKKISKKAAKYTNAILRNLQRSIDKVECRKHAASYLPISREEGWLFDCDIFPVNRRKYLSTVYSYPEFLVNKWYDFFGEEHCIYLLEMGNTPPTVTVRIRDGFTCSAFTPIGVDMAKVSGSIKDIPGYDEGAWVVQGIASNESIHLVGVEKDSLVLDLCAAPGGKSFHIADQMQGSGIIFSCDKSIQRLQKLVENKQRLQVQNVYPIAVDARDLPQSWHNKFDYVLVDAPCSNSGVFNKRVEARWRFSAKTLRSLRKEQYALLCSGAQAVKEGGFLTYSTCSIEEDENRGIIEKFMRNFPEFSCTAHKIMLPKLPIVDGGSVHVLKKNIAAEEQI